MSQDEIEKLRAREEFITRELAQIKKDREALELKMKAELNVVVTANSMLEGAVIVAITPEIRDDVLKLLRETPGRMYNYSNNTNQIPLEHWRKFHEQLLLLPKIDFAFKDGVEKKIDEVLNAPRWTITVSEDKKFLEVKLGYKVGTGPLGYTSGTTYYSGRQIYKVQLSEGVKLWYALQNELQVVWSDEARDLILGDIERREKLDTIALKESSPEYGALIKFLDESVKLRGFQEVGIEFGEATNFRYINSDQMGLGKTIQDIALYMLLRQRLGGKVRAAVICPAAVKINWLREIERLIGITPGMFNGSEPGVRDLERLVVSKSDPICIFNYDILARVKETFKSVKDEHGNEFRQDVVKRYLWVDLINASDFDIIFVDESHYIKNVDSQRSVAVRMLKCPRIVFTSGTPVLNRPNELWPMLTMIAPDLFPSEERFKARYGEKEAKNVEELRGLVKPYLLRRRKKDVMKDLPAIERITDYHEMSPKAWKLYEKILQGVYIALDAWNPGQAGAEQAVPNILAQIMRLKQVCAIDKLDRVAELATELYDTHENGGANKVIVFSQFKPIAHGIAKRLGQEAVVLTGDSGNEAERMKIVDEFQNNPNVHFLCGTWQVMGEGRNLTAAGYVIFSDLFWTPANHQQCEERCYGRVGDMHGATSYYVVVKDTIEDWIQDILARKLKVIEQVVEGYEGDRSASIAGELLKKMKQEMYKLRGK